MAKFTFKLPDIGEGIAEAEIVAWHVKPGDRVEEDQQIADMMTDKATVEMESPVTGTVVEVAGEVGDTIAIGSMLVVIETEGDDAVEDVVEAAPAPTLTAEVIEERIEVETPDASDVDDAIAADPAPAPAPALTPAPEPAHVAKVLASPAVRARAKDLGIDLGQVKPAADGRLRHSDLDAFLSYNGGYAPAGKARADEPVKVI